MDRVDVTLPLPEDLVERATAAGLLLPEQMVALLEAALERKDHLQILQADLERLRALSEPMSDDEVASLVNEEIDAYRAEKRSKQTGRN